MRAGRLLPTAVLLAAIAASSLAIPGAPAAAAECVPGKPAPPHSPAPRLRFGITPAGAAGAAGTPAPVVPGTPGQTLSALRDLRAPGSPLVLRLTRFFWSQGQAGLERFLRQARFYTDRGFLVEIQLRYHPTPAQEGHIGHWVRFVRRVTAAFGRIPGVVGLQVANEVNLAPIAPDASDSYFAGAEKALVRGVIAAGNVVRERGYRQLKIGFNWVYWPGLATEQTFFEDLHDLGGAAFTNAVDWVGLDAYPGTFYPPLGDPGSEGEGDIAAMAELRECLMPVAGLGRRVPIRIAENGWPTGPGRTEARQANALRAMVKAVDRYRGAYGVSDFRWFDLRDHNSASPNLQHHYGLMLDDYTPKPAFGAYRKLIKMLGRVRR